LLGKVETPGGSNRSVQALTTAALVNVPEGPCVPWLATAVRHISIALVRLGLSDHFVPASSFSVTDT
jgi:hypothetical protein